MVRPVLRSSRDANGTYCVHFEIFNIGKEDADKIMWILDEYLRQLEKGEDE